MTEVIYGYFDSALSLHKQIITLCTHNETHAIDEHRLMVLYSGAIAECLLDYDDWKEGLNKFFNQNDESFNDSIFEAQWHDIHAITQSFYQDKDSELGRSVVRSYLDDCPETSFMMLRNIRSSLLAIHNPDSDFWSQLYDATCLVLTTEQLIHNLCDEIIDIEIGSNGWTLGDCVQSMGALSGAYYARSIEIRSLGHSKQAVINHGFDYLVQTIMAEALRLGMPDHAGVYTMLPANDSLPHIPYNKVEDVDKLAIPLFDLFKISDSCLKSLIIAKATGRMMAVAAAGDNANMDSCVVTPLALTSMQGTYNQCLTGIIQA
jgi:hypothetical protein